MEDNNFEALKAYIESLLSPNVANILKQNDWEKIKESCSLRYAQMDSTPIASFDFIDYIIGCKGSDNNRKEQCNNFIAGFNNSVDEAYMYCEEHPSLKHGIDRIIRNLMIASDKDVSSKNSDFKNRLNELLAYNFLAGCCDVNVVAIEEKLDNGKRVDFVVKSKTTNECRGYEVVTIQGIDPSKQDNSDTMNTFISDRIEIKRKEKFGDLSSSGRISSLHVMPIIEWNDGLKEFYFMPSNPCSTPIFTNSLCLKDGRCSLELCEINEYINSIYKDENNA